MMKNIWKYALLGIGILIAMFIANLAISVIYLLMGALGVALTASGSPLLATLALPVLIIGFIVMLVSAIVISGFVLYKLVVWRKFKFGK